MKTQKTVALDSENPGGLKGPLLDAAKQPTITTNQNAISSKQYSFFSIFMYASSFDIFLMIIGTICCIINGAAMPYYTIVFGSMTDNIFGTSSDNNFSNLPNYMQIAGEYAIKFLIIGGFSFISSFIGLTSWTIAGERQTLRYRKEYFKALIRQDVSWYDGQNPNEFSTKIANDTFAIQGALGDKVSTFIYVITMCIGGFTVGFIRGWELAAVLSAAILPMGLSVSYYSLSIATAAKTKNNAYEKSGGIAEEALTSIKTVVGLCGEEKELNKYTTALKETKRIALKAGIRLGFSMGLIYLIIFCNYALGFWAGSKFVADGKGYTLGNVLTVFFAITTATMTIGRMAPCIKAFVEGKEAFKRVIEIIKNEPSIKLTGGKELESIKGDIMFNDVEFFYPNRPENQILKRVNLHFPNGKKTALVGESGSGKSTCMQLIERFYDAANGSIIIDGMDIKDLNLEWLRENIGYVGQEPVLFAASIKENLLFAKPDATDQELVGALAKANAYDFINSLADKLDTFVGPGGAQLSGGQKQRIAIARAILKNPKILLLDEATSALDRKNELEIQSTLDQLSVGRTTIVVAHRLTTIQNADNIIVLERGEVIEEGTHESLMAHGTVYPRIQSTQTAIAIEYNNKKVEVDPNMIKNLEDVIDVKIDDYNGTKSTKEDGKLIKDDGKLIKDDEQEAEKKKAQEELNKKLIEKYPGKQLFSRILDLNKNERYLFFIGVVIAIGVGMVFPAFSIIFSKMLNALSMVQIDNDTSESNNLCIAFLVIAVVSFILTFLNAFIFSYIGESLAYKIRVVLFGKMLKMHMGWFDIPRNAPGNLATRLAADAGQVQNLTSTVISVIIQAGGSLIAGLVIALIHAWNLTLISLATVPFSMIASGAQQKLHKDQSKINDEAYKDSSSVLTEAVCNIRTVYALSSQKPLYQLYEKKLAIPTAGTNKKGLKSGFIFGISNFLVFAIYAVTYYCGLWLLSNQNIDSAEDMFTAIFGLMFAAFGSGAAAAFMPDVGATQNAARAIFEIIDEPTLISNKPDAIKAKQPGERLRGNIVFKNVSFKYPTRDQQIFENLAFEIQENNKIALVGPSGCGKSTIVQLLLRFYDIDKGQIVIDGHDIRDYDLHYLRSSIGLVSQEPVLFNGTIRDNISYTKSDATIDEIKNAATNANCLGFIESNQFETNEANTTNFGEGFDRLVGPKGSQISGGQKQRIAIARAILNNPSILLFDEATSALDGNNEAIVQDSLNKVMTGKTTITIAHRISTIVDSDDILVFINGKIVEHGNYDQLIAKKDIFYRLAQGKPVD